MQKHPRTLELKIVAMGNSHGVRLPKAVIDKAARVRRLITEMYGESCE